MILTQKLIVIIIIDLAFMKMLDRTEKGQINEGISDASILKLEEKVMQ